MNRRQLLLSCCAAPLGVMPMAARSQGLRASLSGETLDGRPYALQQDLGKVVLVFFWSTSCPVCRDKMPELRLNYEAWRDKGFQLLAVSVDRNIDGLRGYDAILNRIVPPTQRFPWLWRSASGHRDSFGPVVQTPTSYLVDRKGQVVRQFLGRIEAALWDDIAELVLT